MTESCGM